MRTLGDTVTRLDRIETELNEAAPGDPRDTTTPAAMAGRHPRAGVRRCAQRDIARAAEGLADRQQDRRHGRLRAGVPEGWIVGDKTGSGERGTNNDVGILFPPGRAPMILCVYLTETSASFEARNATIAAVAKAAATIPSN